MDDHYDCLIIGGGPAGFTAAIYLARFRLSVCVVDSGHSRAASIPCTRNHAGFPGGISGAALLDRMRTQALEFGARYAEGVVTALAGAEPGFAAQTGDGVLRARSVLLATGVTNNRPEMADGLHREALWSGRIRYCPICDGYEVIGKRVCVIGSGARGMRGAEFLRSFTPHVTLAPDGGPHVLGPSERQGLADVGIKLIEAPAEDYRLTCDGIGFRAGADRYEFDSIYPALGSVIHSDLAADLGATCTEEGCLTVDAHQRTTVPGLYAAGDVVLGLDQISHAMGEGGVAAVTMRNDLAAAASPRLTNH